MTDNAVTGVPAVLVAVGASGAGKTTLVGLLAAERIPVVGCYHFDTIGVPSDAEILAGFGSGWAYQACGSVSRPCSLTTGKPPRPGVPPADDPFQPTGRLRWRVARAMVVVRRRLGAAPPRGRRGGPPAFAPLHGDMNMDMDTPDAGTPAALVRRVLEAALAGDLAALAAHPGLATLAGALPRLRAAFPDLAASYQQHLSEGDRVAVHYVLTGTHRGPLFGLAPTGKTVRFQNVAIARVADERIVQFNSEVGYLNVFLQLGVLPFGEPPGARVT